MVSFNLFQTVFIQHLIKCVLLVNGLPNRNDEIKGAFREIKDDHATNICNELANKPVTCLRKFFRNYTNQVDTLLHMIRSCRQSNHIDFLAALDDQCKYSFAHDLYNYARMKNPL